MLTSAQGKDGDGDSWQKWNMRDTRACAMRELYVPDEKNMSKTQLHA